jgi:3-hydroxyacyl-[acyl-carrier-protein] dehydratase
MPDLLCDPREWQDAQLLHGLEQIQARIPQRYEMGLLHGIVHHDQASKLALGVHFAKPTDFWVRGHIPGRPLMPGVVMVEVAAQLCTWLASFDLPQERDKLLGFGGIDHVRFRGQVVPGDRMLVAAQVLKLRRNLGTFRTQSFVRDELVYEGEIIGIIV